MKNNTYTTRTLVLWMRWIGLSCLLLAGLLNSASAQITVTGCTGPGNGSYTTLGAAITAIGTAQPAANIVISVTASTTEGTATIAIGAGTWATMTISPSGGAWTISAATTAGLPMIDFNGADNVTINGLNSGGNALTIQNTTVSATSGTSTIRFQTDATNNTITNCSILGSSTMATTTNGGNIWFGAAAVTTGNDGNTISNCNIGPAGVNLPTKAIYGNGSTTTATLNNSGITINNCNIFDYFNAAAQSNGMYIGAGNTDWNITNNRFYQTATRTQTTSALHCAIQVSNTTSANNFQITGNTIGFSSSAGTGTYTLAGVSNTFIGINMSVNTTGTPCNISGNTITAISQTTAASGTSSSSPCRLIYIGSGLVNVGSTGGNNFGSLAGTSSISFTTTSISTTDVYCVYNFGSHSCTYTGNNIGNITLTAASTSIAFFALRINTSSTAGITATITNNTIGASTGPITNNATGTSSRVVGIQNDLATPTITGNTVRNMSMSAANTGTGTASSVLGIYNAATTNAPMTFSQNTVHSLSNSNAAAAIVVTGMAINGPAGASNVAARNFVHSLNCGSATGTIHGIFAVGGTTTYQNNMVRLGIDAAGSNITTACAINGISETTAGTDNFYFNSVYIGGTGVGTATSNTFAFNSTITINTRNFRNNIFQNSRSNATTGGKHYAVQVGGTAPNPGGLTINYNIYYVSGTGGVFGRFNALDVADLSAWKTAVGQDANSWGGLNPQYLTPNGTSSTVDLHINSAIASPVEAKGINIAAVTDDFDGQTRSTLTPEDIGADALNGTALPTCSGTPASSTITGASSVCTGSGTTLGLSATYTDIGLTIQWGSSTVSGGPYSPMGTASTQATGNLTVTTYYSCTITCTISGLSFTTPEYTITINPLPTVAVSPTSGSYCTPGGSAVGLTGSGASTYAWSPASGLSATTGATVNASPSASTTYTVTGTDANGCVNTATSSITVSAFPVGVAATATPSVICAGGNSQLQGTANVPGSANAYSFSTSTGATLDPMTGATTVIASSVDDTPTGSPAAIGFSFNFNGTVYTQYSVSPDGWIMLGGATAASEFTNVTTSTANLPKIYGYWDDLATGTTGSVKTLLSGSAPNRIFITQWFVTIPRLTTGAANSTFQVWLYEGSNKVEIRYGTMGTPTSGSISAGLTAGATNFQSITFSSNTASTVTANDVNTTAPASGRMYTFNLPSASSFSWSPSTFLNNPAISNPLASGVTSTTTYTVSATNSGCVATASVTVTAGNPLSCGTITTSGTPCAGSQTLTAHPTGGGSPYTYSWDNGGGTAQSATAAVGTITYTVTVTDACGATCTSSITVTTNPLPGVSVSPSSGTYCTPTGAAVALTASGASTYAWSPATGLNATTGASVNATPSTASTYTVTGTDANGCVNTATSSIAVGASVNVSNVSATPNPVCAGGNSQLLVVGGTTATYAVASTTYGLISGTGTTAVTGDDVASASIALPFNFSFFGTTYSSLFVHSNGFASFTSGQPTGSPYLETIPNSATPNNYIAICHDDLNVTGGGTVTYFTSGSAPNRVFVINWSAVKFYNSAANSGDMSGQIQMFERDMHIEVHVTSSNDPVLSAHTIGIENAGGTLGYAAPGRNNVSYSFTNTTPEAWAFYPNGGTLSYDWSPITYLNNKTIANPLASGMVTSEVYTVTITSASGCSATSSLSVNVGSVLSTGASVSSTSVCDGQTITLTASPTGGGAPYSYDWNDGGGSVGTTSPLTILPVAGHTTDYTVTVTDACGAIVTASVTVTSNSLPTVSIDPAAPSICGAGSVSLLASGASTYAWSPAAGLNNTAIANPTATVSTSTNYTVVGTDGNGCTNTASVSITVNPPVTGTAATASPATACEGSTVNLGGSAVISGYTMNPSCGTGFVDISTSGTSVGTISDDSEHNITLPFTFYFNGTPYTTARVGNNGLMAFGSTTGDLYYGNTCLPQNGTVSSTSGLGNAGSQVIAALWDDLTPGTGGSIKTQQIGSVFYIQWTNEDNFSATGTGTVTFQIQLEQTTNIITLSYLDVVYGVAGFDNGQTATVGLNLDPSNAVAYSCNTASLTNGQCISFVPQTLTYSWAGPNGFTSGSQNPTLTGVTPLATGTYTVTATSGAGCTGTATVSVTVDPTITTAMSSSNVSCNGGSNGSATVTPSGGTGSFTYSWAPSGGSGATASGLTAGTYTVTVTDGICSATASVTITQPTALVATCSVVSNVSCNGGTDGSASVSASGGTSPYSGTGTFTGLAAGTYNYTVTDANGCTASCSVTITEPPALVATCSVISNVSCNGGSDGSASVSASGGTSPYSGTGSFTGLAAGTYSYTVTDANGCTASCSVTISQPTALSLVCTPTNESYPGANDGSVNIVASGGTSPYTNDGLHGGLTAGTYTYTVTDANGCTTSCTSTVGSNCVPSTSPVSASASASEICAGNNVSLSVTGGSLGTGASWVWYEGGCGAGASIGSGATITTPAIITPGVHTFYVRAEGLCGTTSCVSVSVTVTSGAPTGSITIPVATAPVSGCVGGSASISCTAVAGATGYSWSGPAGLLFNGQPSPYVSTSTTVTVSYTALPPSGISGWNVCVFAKNACGNGVNTKCHWIRATISTPTFTSAAAIGCPNTTGIYSVAPVDGAATYNWTITGGNASLNGAGASVVTTTPLVNVSFGPAFSSGSLCVSATTSCGYTGGTRCVTITTAPAIPGAISGSTTICPGANSNYSITPVTGAVSYNWTVTGSGLSVVGSGTSAVVSTTAAFTSGSVCVVAVSSCGGSSAQRCKTLGTGKLSTPGNITGDPTTGVCGQTYTYSIPSMSGATGGYTWTLPAGATGSSTSNSITVTFPAAFTSGTLCVHGNNSCGAGPDRCVNVFGNPGTPASLSGNQTPCIGYDEVYTWPSVPGATDYLLVVPVGYTVISGNPTISNFAIINIGATTASIGVKAENACGVSGTRTLALAPVSCRLAGNQPEVVKALATQVFPNPTTGLLNVQFNSATNDAAYVINVLDLSGRTVLSTEGKANAGSNLQVLDLNNLSKGMYMISLQTNEGTQLVRVSVE